MLSALIFGALLIAGIVELALLAFLSRACALGRPLRAEDWAAIASPPARPIDPSSPYGRELAGLSTATEPLARALAGMAWLMNRVRTVEPTVATSTPERMLAQIDVGGGALCGQMAHLYRSVMVSLGVAGRR